MTDLPVDFSKVRYAQCWEDADILLKALPQDTHAHYLSIASAGDNALSLLTKQPARVVAIDLSAAQLHCLSIRVAAYRHLSHQELLELIGSIPSQQRKKLIAKCQPSLSSENLKFCSRYLSDIEKYGLGGIGKFERYFRIFKNRLLPLVHSKRTILSLLSEKSITDRKIFYNHQWNSRRWKWLVKLFFSKWTMGHLGRDPTFFNYVKGGVAEHVNQRVAHALTELNPCDNPYLQWILTGQHLKALPFALREENFELIRANLHKISWHCASLNDFLNHTSLHFDAFNLSDIFEYMSLADYQKLYLQLLNKANKAARLVYWNMMAERNATQFSQSWPCEIKSLTTLSQSLYAQDKAFFYGRLIIEEVGPC